MTKKSSALLFLLFFVIFSPTFVSAQVTGTQKAAPRIRPAQADTQPDASGSGTKRPAIASGSAMPRIASRSASLRDKLAVFKDRKKASTIERISTNLVNVNQKRTSQMMQHVDTLSGILTKADERVTEAQVAGLDITDAMTELGLSKTALANAKIAVQEQSKKTYEIQISTESGARADVKEARDLLEQDMKSTHALVKESRRILINALIKLSQVIGGTTTNESN